MGDGAIPAEESTAELSKAPSVLADVVTVHDVQTQTNREEEGEQEGHDDDEFGCSEDGREDNRHEPDDAERPQRAGEGGVSNFLSDCKQHMVVVNTRPTHGIDKKSRLNLL